MTIFIENLQISGFRVLSELKIDSFGKVNLITGKNNCGKSTLLETIHRYGGKAPLIDGIGVRLKGSDITALGILIDADTNLQSCWQAVTNRLRQAGYKEIPAPLAPEGTIMLEKDFCQ